MQRKLLLVLFVFMMRQCTTVRAQSSATQQVTCGPNEIAVNCPKDCPTDYCPCSASQNQTCPEQSCDQNATGCKCFFNYRRARNGSCIRTEDCPPFDCGPNEHYDPCPPYCPTDSCADVKYKGMCPYRILIRLQCFPKCRCNEGFARNNGKCVPTFLCPGQQAYLCLCRGNSRPKGPSPSCKPED